MESFQNIPVTKIENEFLKTEKNMTFEEMVMLLNAVNHFYKKALIKLKIVTAKEKSIAKLREFLQEVFAVDASQNINLETDNPEFFIDSLIKRFDAFINNSPSTLASIAKNQATSKKVKLALISKNFEKFFYSYKVIVNVDTHPELFKVLTKEMHSAYRQIQKELIKHSFSWLKIFNLVFKVNETGRMECHFDVYKDSLKERLSTIKELFEKNKQLKDNVDIKMNIQNKISSLEATIGITSNTILSITYQNHALQQNPEIKKLDIFERVLRSDTYLATAFFALYDQFEKIDQKFSDIENLIETNSKNFKERAELLKEYKLQRNKIDTFEIKKLYKTVKQQFNLFDDMYAYRLSTTDYKKYIESYEIKLKRIKEDIKSIEWPEKCPKEIDNKKSLNIKAAADNHAIKQVTRDLNQIADDIKKSEVKICDQMDSKAKEILKARQESKLEQEKKYAEHKKQIEDERNKREAEKTSQRQAEH